MPRGGISRGRFGSYPKAIAAQNVARTFQSPAEAQAERDNFRAILDVLHPRRGLRAPDGTPILRAADETPEPDEIRRDADGRELSPLEAARLDTYNDILREVRALEPDYAELTSPDWVPDDAALARIKAELAAARARIAEHNREAAKAAASSSTWPSTPSDLEPLTGLPLLADHPSAAEIPFSPGETQVGSAGAAPRTTTNDAPERGVDGIEPPGQEEAVAPAPGATYKIGESDGGPGTMVMSDRYPYSHPDAARYQQQATGAPPGVEYQVTVRLKGDSHDTEKLFDGYDPSTGRLVEAKRWNEFPPDGFLMDQEVDKLIKAARVAAATKHGLVIGMSSKVYMERVERAFRQKMAAEFDEKANDKDLPNDENRPEIDFEHWLEK